MAKSPWFKFYASDFLLDSKVDSLPLEAQAILIRMWSVIWIDGSIPDDPKIISRLCRIDISSVQKHMQNLMQMFHKDASGFLHSKRMEDEMSKYGHISNARKHAAEVRWNKQDTKLANANGNANGHAKAMQSESESDINLFKQNSSKRGTRLSDEFQVTDAHRQFSSKENLPSPDLLIAEFRDYWKSQPGAKGVKLDWDATFRNWIRNSSRMGRSRGLFPQASTTGPLTGGLEQVRAHRAANGFKN
jgi:uncharacterized protein YdaU (DUF1376 family)